MEKLKKKIEELKELGFTKEQATELMEIGEKEVLEKVLEEFSAKVDEQTYQDYLQRVKSAKGNNQELTKLFTEIMTHVYGEENVESKREELFVDYVQSIIDLTKETKHVYRKYSEGDPDTVKAVEDAQKEPEVKEMAEEIQKDEEN